MKNIPIRFAAAALFCSLLAGAAPAQMGRFSAPQVMGFWNPVVGAGAVYTVQPAKGDKTEMQIAIVGEEQVDGKDAYWYEMSFNHGNGETIMKSLMVLNGPDTHVSRMIMQMPGRPPMEMPTQMMHHKIVRHNPLTFAQTPKIWAATLSPSPPARSLANITAPKTAAKFGYPQRFLPMAW
jgi:hypothetical protein